jgi:hypothetical protein
MRLKVEIDDLTPEQWDQAQKTLKTSYDIPENASRVCLTLVHGEEERHVETPVSALTSLLWGMSLALAFEALGEAVKTSTRWAPDDDRLPDDRPPVVQNTGAATATGPGSFANTGYVGRKPDA